MTVAIMVLILEAFKQALVKPPVDSQIRKVKVAHPGHTYNDLKKSS